MCGWSSANGRAWEGFWGSSMAFYTAPRVTGFPRLAIA